MRNISYFTGFLCLLFLIFGSEDVWAAVRGPYLQSGGATRMTVQWRSVTASKGEVRYGTDPLMLTKRATSSAVTVDHTVHISGLKPDTTYYYSIGTPSVVNEQGPEYFFKTPPVSSATKSVRVWVLGDSGSSGAAAVRDGFMAFNGSASVDAMLMLGDNAYQRGTDAEYQSAVFERFAAQLRNTVLWPSIGNHDTDQSRDPSKQIAYTDIFSLPTRGECGGTPSGTERYYSFDYGDVHFVCLDSMTSSPNPNDAMARWLRADLAGARKKWLVAFWHHAPYSKTSHDSDSDLAMRAMRENIVPILEDAGVDLVLCGHSHAYERSKLINEHYGLANSLQTNSILNYEPDVYRKPPNIVPRQGAAYVVAGTASSVVGTDEVPEAHPAMQRSFRRLGSVVLDIHAERLEVKFVSTTGSVDDSFVIDKSMPPAPEIIASSSDDAYGIGTFRTFSVPSINNAGKIAFLARIATQTGTVNAIVADGIIAQDKGSSFVKVGEPLLNNLGEVAFFATETGGAEEGLYSNRGGTVARIARAGAVAPGASGAIWKAIIATHFTDEWIAFTASLRGRPQNQDKGLWFSTPSETKLALSEGDVLSFIKGNKTVHLFDTLQVSPSTRAQGHTPDTDEVFVRATFTDKTQAVLAFTPTGYREVAATDALAPWGIFGARFDTFGPINGAAFLSKLIRGFGLVTSANDTALFAWDGELIRAFAKGSRPEPTLIFDSFKAYTNAPNAGTAVIATVIGTNVTTLNDTGVWWKKGDDSSHLLTREGSNVPRVGGRFSSFTTLALSGGENGAPVFVATMKSGFARIAPSSDMGLWGANSNGYAELLLIEGQKIGSKTVRNLAILGNLQKSRAQTRSVNATGQIAARVTYSDHSQSIVVITRP